MPGLAQQESTAFAVLTGSNGRKTSEFQLKCAFQLDNYEVFHVDLEDVGEPLEGLSLRHDNIGPLRYLDHIEVRPMQSVLPAASLHKKLIDFKSAARFFKRNML